MSIWSRFSTTTVQLLTATALTSLSFHLLFARRDAAELRGRYAARISILESLISRLNQGEAVDFLEIERMTTLGRKLQEEHITDHLGDSERGSGENLSWKEVILGAPRKMKTTVTPEEQAAREWNIGDSDRKVSSKT